MFSSKLTSWHWTLQKSSGILPQLLSTKTWSYPGRVEANCWPWRNVPVQLLYLSLETHQNITELPHLLLGPDVLLQITVLIPTSLESLVFQPFILCPVCQLELSGTPARSQSFFCAWVPTDGHLWISLFSFLVVSPEFRTAGEFWPESMQLFPHLPTSRFCYLMQANGSAGQTLVQTLGTEIHSSRMTE